MVYVYAKQSEINKYVAKNLTVDEIENTLKDLGMDIKGVSDEKDPELKVEITAEKADMISFVGIGRAIRYYLGIEKEVPRYVIEPAKEKVIVEESVSKVRPRTVCVILKDIDMTQELLDEMIKIQEKIHESFGRNRKKASIGIYPMDEIKFPVYFRAEKPEEIKFHPLEGDGVMDAHEILENHETGRKYAHLLSGNEVFPVFRDAKGDVLSLPPIINSHTTGRVDLHHRDLFIEISGFNQSFLDNLLKVMITTFIEFGAKAQAVTVEYPDETYELDLSPTEDKISIDYVNKLIGINITSEDAKELFPKMMYGVKSVKDDTVEFEIPCFRSDVWHDVDVADDIARAYGYNNIVPKFPSISTVGEHLPLSQFRERISNTLVQMGFLELYTYMLTSTEVQFRKMNLDEEKFNFIRLIDSEDQGLNMVRIINLPETLSSLHINRKNKYPQKVFENGFTIQVDDNCDTGARNEAHLTVSIADPKSNYTQIKGVLDTLLKLNEISFDVIESNHVFMIEGRQANIVVDGIEVGFIGELHPSVLENFGLLVPVCSFELNLEKIYEILNTK